MSAFVHSILPTSAQAERLGYKFVTEAERKAQLPYSVLIESARQNLPADHPERQRIEAQQKASQEYSETPRIELTERDFKSDRFMESLAHICSVMRSECQKLQNFGRLDPKSVIAKMWSAGELEEHYLKVHGAFCYFKKSKLPREKRILVNTLFNDAIEHYRRQRNAQARTNYKVRKIKKQLAEEGIADVDIHKL